LRTWLEQLAVVISSIRGGFNEASESLPTQPDWRLLVSRPPIDGSFADVELAELDIIALDREPDVLVEYHLRR